MDERKHKIYFAVGIDENRDMFYKFGQTITTIHKRFLGYRYKTKRTLHLLFFYELEVPKNQDDRWEQANIAEHLLRETILELFQDRFSLCGERFYIDYDWLQTKEEEDRELIFSKAERKTIIKNYEQKLRDHNINFTKGEVW